jgi:hypothetical protein
MYYELFVLLIITHFKSLPFMENGLQCAELCFFFQTKR